MIDINKKLQPFLISIQQLRKEINTIHQSTNQINEQILLIECETYEELTNQPNINDLINKTNQLTLTINSKLTELQSKYNFHSIKTQKNETIQRIITNHINCINNSFFKNMKEYQIIQSKMKKTIERKLYQKMISFNPELSELIEENEIDQINHQFIECVGNKQDLYLFEYLQGFHKDILSLKQSIEEVHQLFISFDILVKNQQEIIQSIEDHCNEIKEYVNNANDSIEETIQIKKKYYEVCFFFYNLFYE